MAEAPRILSQFDQDEEELAADDAFYAALSEADLQPLEPSKNWHKADQAKSRDMVAVEVHQGR